MDAISTILGESCEEWCARPQRMDAISTISARDASAALVLLGGLLVVVLHLALPFESGKTASTTVLVRKKSGSPVLLTSTAASRVFADSILKCC